MIYDDVSSLSGIFPIKTSMFYDQLPVLQDGLADSTVGRLSTGSSGGALTSWDSIWELHIGLAYRTVSPKTTEQLECARILYSRSLLFGILNDTWIEVGLNIGKIWVSRKTLTWACLKHCLPFVSIGHWPLWTISNNSLLLFTII